MTNTGRRVAVIGLDGAVPSLVFDDWRDELPTLSSLIADGVCGTVRSTHPPITVPAWTSMLSSKDPGQLGCYGFRNRRGHGYGDYAFATATAVRHERVWDVFGRAGRRSLLLGVPQTYPPQAVRGWLVSCFLTPSSEQNFAYPPELQREVQRACGGEYPFDVDDFRSADKDALLARLQVGTRSRFRVARHLAATKPWDFFMMVEIGVDRAQHGFWRHMDPTHPGHRADSPYADAIRDYYRLVDQEIAELLSVVGDDVVTFVLSDHGAKAMQGGFFLNEWLMRRGDLQLLSEPTTLRPFDAAMVDWSRTRAWAEGGYYGRVFLNMRGRESNGTVDQADYERLRNELIDSLEAVEGPTGNRLGIRAHRPEELYRDVTGIAPDLMVYLDDLRWRALGSVGSKTLYAEENDGGPDDANHDWEGIFVMRDPHERMVGRGASLQAVDVAPTLLARAGLEIPTDMIGRAFNSEASSII